MKHSRREGLFGAEQEGKTLAHAAFFSEGQPRHDCSTNNPGWVQIHPVERERVLQDEGFVGEN